MIWFYESEVLEFRNSELESKERFCRQARVPTHRCGAVCDERVEEGEEERVEEEVLEEKIFECMSLYLRLLVFLFHATSRAFPF